jgi:hypothetical protein|tara:strand:- start:1038 stop:1175 length:138 start_codon:yes stop_codon:yes gene_type:complete
VQQPKGGTGLATLFEDFDATQVYYCMSIGASRMEETKVVEIACNE